MGTYMRAVAEVKTLGGWKANTAAVFMHPVPEWNTAAEDRRPFIEKPFYWQSYGMFGFLAGIRNYSETRVLAEPRGLPDDCSRDAATWLQDWSECYGFSWLNAAELLSFDYEQAFLDQRESPPKATTYRKFLGELFFEHLEALRGLGEPTSVRVLVSFN